MARPKIRNQRLNGKHPLSYKGVNPVTPPQFTMQPRVPNTSDFQGFEIGDLWLNIVSLTQSPAVAPTAEDLYILVAKLQGEATWVNFASGATALETLTGDTGGAVPGDAADNIFLLGTAGNITTAGNPGTNTITFNTGGAVATSYPTDAGTAIPALGVLNVLGGTAIATAGAGNTVTINAGATIPLQFTTDAGVAIPAANNLNVLGAHGINTSGAGSTVTTAINNAITLGDLANIAAGSNALTINTGDIQFAATNGVGNLRFPDTPTTGNAGVIEFNNRRFLHNGGTVAAAGSTVYLGDLAGNFTTTAGRNVGIGDGALQSVTIGGSNAVVGSNAAVLLTEGIQNAAVGRDCLGRITTGNRNAAVGDQAAGSIAPNFNTGNENCAFGSRALLSITSGSGNIAVGGGQNTMGNVSGPLFQLLTGSFNIGIGGSLLSSTTGAGSAYTGAESSNICLGHATSGTVGENNTMRLGTTGAGNGQVSRAFVAGVHGVTPAGATQFMIIDAAGQMGSTSSSVTTINYTNVNTTPYVVLGSDVYLGVDCSGGAITIQLPNAPATGRVLIIKDRTGNANTNNITVTTVGGVVLIDGATTYVMNTQYAAINVLFDGTTYQIY